MTELLPHLVIAGGLAVAASLMLAPLEALGWWAGWLGPGDESEAVPPEAPAAQQPDFYVVFLSGIGSISGDELLPQEAALLDRLEAALPRARIVRDVFPYAPSGRPLMTGQRLFAWLWRQVLRWRLSGRHVLPMLLNVRNMFQVLVSADHRYGPLYSFAMANIVRERLAAHGYPAPAGPPVILLGVSGGGQISIGSATYLGAVTEAPIGVVTVGGVMASDRGLAEIVRLASLHGSRDSVYALGRLVFPGRWPAAATSFWNVAADEGRLTEEVIGPMGHAGRGGYLDMEARADGGPPYFELTARAAVGAIDRVGSALCSAGGRLDPLALDQS